MADTDEMLLQPLPMDTDNNEMKEEDEDNDGLIPLPVDVDEATNDATEVPSIPMHDENDSEMKDNANPNSNSMEVDNNQSQPVPPPPTNTDNNDKEEIVEEEEEGGIIEEEVAEEGGGIIEEVLEEDGGTISAIPPPPPTNDNAEKKESQPKPKPKAKEDTKEKKEEEKDKDRPKFYAITTDSTKPRYLQLHLMREWTNGEVLGWLTHRFGFWGQQYVPMFSNKQVDGSKLSELTAEDLKTEFGVTKPLHLVRMCRDIKDASRPIHQINQLIAPCFADGGNAAAKLMRFGPKEVHKWCTKVRGLKIHAETFLRRQISGRVLLACNEKNLDTAMGDSKLTILDHQGILEFIDKIKKEPSMDLNTTTETDYAPIKAIYDTWNEMCKINERRFKLLPQHIRDYTKPPPTYYPPPQHTLGQRGGPGPSQNNAPRPQHGGFGMGQRQQEDRSGTPPLYEIKPVTEWNTEDCCNWLGQIRDSKVDLRVRYTPHFEQLKMTGTILLNMTPSTLSDLCCITTKTHLKHLVKAIDRIRDHLVFTTFGQHQHVKDFQGKYGGGYNFPRTSYEDIDRRQSYNASPQSAISARSRRPRREADAGGEFKKASYQDLLAQAKPSSPGSINTKRKTRPRSQQQSQQGQDMQCIEVPKDKKDKIKDKDEQPAACYVCGKTGNVMRCSQCKQAFYCSREHQVDDWARHSKECNK